MPRVKRGVTARASHKKTLSYTKGHRATKHTTVRRATESMFKALSHMYRHRRERKGDMRKLWIARINAAARVEGTTYSRLIAGLTEQGITVNRKMLADLAVKDQESFKQFASFAVAKESFAAGKK